MKKTLVSALTTALVIGAASTTFAASNPFSDVPADHWAYDAVTQLAADGVIEGYGDSTFQGNKNITRYEMAQMVAKAMAKTDVSAADKALIDKLAAEFSDELNNLGVRVSNLEKHSDMVKWNGKLRYTYSSKRVEDEAKDDSKDKTNKDELLFRLEPTAEVNDHWNVKARLDAKTYLDSDSGNGSDDVKLKRAYAEGNYKNFSTQLGKFGLYTPEEGLVFDDEMSGAKVTFGKDLKASLYAGRLDLSDSATAKNMTGGSAHYDDTANMQGITLQYSNPAASKLSAAYANNTSADNLNHSWQALYNYKGAQAENKGTWGAYAGYRYLGTNASLFGTQDAQIVGAKGWEIGANYAPFKNVVATAKYFNGKGIESDRDAETLWGRVEFQF